MESSFYGTFIRGPPFSVLLIWYSHLIDSFLGRMIWTLQTLTLCTLVHVHVYTLRLSQIRLSLRLQYMVQVATLTPDCYCTTRTVLCIRNTTESLRLREA